MIWLALLLGIAIGVLSGLIGTGGGTLIIPALVYFFRMNQHRAQGTSLGVLLLPTVIFAFVEYYKAGNVDVKIALLLALGFLVGGYFGGAWAHHVSDAALRRTFALVMALVAVRMFFQK